MSLLSSQALAHIRRIVEGMMTGRCTIERQQDSRGSIGQIAHTWEIVSQDTHCRLITSKGATLPATEVFADRITMEDTYTISLPVGTEISVDYRVTVNDTTWRVANVLDNRTDRTDVQAVLTRMRDE